mmetsp:Transcript_23968/g.50506  ORF Transcript_23968/g.50506 Transcript_23968/m.50506 type:complete len:335 (+) Transcript_23968:90-1094(+)|eukprot:CAMPEP_0171351924 /NCGR_PEP_ID=MMETSP0878-20121228/40177_1 /TAXON_ID=67004 /ORGANISM="Thalassiosira weissflogii, Strain CCMP1336" /LENGTH=334 /DNA_ID=CAMNT_0011857355 /DNA_START=31 /DNA_END=1035 /DNA_ORIENTATION=+
MKHNRVIKATTGITILFGLSSFPSFTQARKLGSNENDGSSKHNNEADSTTNTVIFSSPTSTSPSATSESTKDASESNQVASTTEDCHPETEFEDAIREIVEEFSHMTSLHESLNFIPHPFFYRPRGFGVWGYDEEGDTKKSPRGKKFTAHLEDVLSPWGKLTRWSPRYEVIDDAKTFQVTMDVPGFHFHEMSVELESGGQVLSIIGMKEENDARDKKFAKERKYDETSKIGSMEGKQKGEDDAETEEETLEFSSLKTTSFQQKFTLDPSIDTTKLTANLVNGKLVVRAPRKHVSFWSKRHVPITQFDEDTWMELIGSGIKDSDGGENADTTAKD